MNDSEKGITESGISKQIVSLEFYISEIKKALSNVSDEFAKIPSAAKSTGIDAVLDSYNNNKSNNDTLLMKLNGNCEYLKEIISNYQNMDQQLVNELNVNKY